MNFRKFTRAMCFFFSAAIILASCGGGGSSVNTGAGTTDDIFTVTDMNTTGTSSETTVPVSVEIDVPDDMTLLPGMSLGYIPDIKDGIGGAELPDMSADADKNAPQLSEITDMTFPNETLAASGDGLVDTSLIIWTEGMLKAVKPLRSDKSKIQATIPADMTKSMMIVWPYNNNGIGNPIRVNAPEVFWFDPAELYFGKAGQTVRFFGSGLYIEGHEPIVVVKYDDGKTETLEIVEKDEYALTAKLKNDLNNIKTCEFYLHNGTGGEYGWSKAQILKVVENTILPENELQVFKVDDYGAKADDGQDDLKAISNAIADAAKVGGGVIEFGAGEYNLSGTLIISQKFSKGLYIKGAGMGKYDFGSSFEPDEYDYEGLSDKYTLIKFLDPAKFPKIFINISSSNVIMTDMTVIGADNGAGHCYNFFVSGMNVTLERLRVMKADLRDFAAANSDLATSTNVEIDNYCHNITIKDCEFHTKASAINVGNIEGIWPWGFFDSKRTVRNIRITGCDFYGYAGPYTSPSGAKPKGDYGEISRALTGFNFQGMIFEGNTVQGFDRKNCKLLVRTIYLSSTCELAYIANNTMKNVGNTPDSGFDLNTGEQILIHGNDFTGGIFNVTETNGKFVTVRTDNIENSNGDPYSASDNTGSRVFNGLDMGTRGNLYVYTGKGVGQTRTVVGYKIEKDKITFELAEEFTVPLDETSIVNLFSYSGYNIIVGNTVANDELILHQGLKTGGVLLFFQGGYNIIAENTFKNLTFGVAINARFKGPCFWNTVRDNNFDGMSELKKDAAQGGDSTYNATFFCVSVVKNSPQGWDDYNAWYAVGNVFRNNVCKNGDYAAELTTNRWNRSPSEWIAYYGEEKGAAMSIIENNKFDQVKTGVLIGNPDYWSLIRNNEFNFKSTPGYLKQELTFEQKQSNFHLLHIKNDEVAKDINNTINEGFGQSVPIK